MSAEALWQGAATAHSEAATAIERAIEKQPSPARNRRVGAGCMKRKAYPAKEKDGKDMPELWTEAARTR
jgi:hypothetical protein